MAKLQDRDLAWVDSAPIRIELSKAVAAPPDEVFAILADHGSWPKWFTSMKAAQGDGTTGVGSTRQVALGPLKADERFLAWEPGRRFSFLITKASAPGLVAFVEDFRLEPAPDDRTTVTYVGGIEPIRALRWAAPVVRWAFGREIDKALTGLAAYAAEQHRQR